MFIGNFADSAGRRPAYIICFIIYIASNIGLALQDSYGALIALRCVQSSGISSSVALSAATVADIATKKERGSMMGFVMAGSFMGPAVGPIIGGLLAQYLGWRSIFWFLTIASGVFFLPLLMFMPETARNVVGDGSEPAQSWNRPLIQYFRCNRNGKMDDASSDGSSDLEPKKHEKLRFPNPIKPLKLVCHVNSIIVLLVTGVIMGANMTVLSSITSIYSTLYGLDVLEIGLCYITMGVGSIVASVVAGRLLDMAYRYLAKQHAPDASTEEQETVPVEKARSMVLVPLVSLGAGMTLAFGWTLQYGVHLAAPEVFMFFIGLGLTGSFICASTLLVDLHTSRPAAATASNNLVRSLFSAAASAAIDPMLSSLGRGWAFTIVMFLLLATIPFLMFLWLGGRRKKNNTVA